MMGILEQAEQLRQRETSEGVSAITAILKEVFDGAIEIQLVSIECVHRLYWLIGRISDIETLRKEADKVLAYHQEKTEFYYVPPENDEEQPARSIVLEKSLQRGG